MTATEEERARYSGGNAPARPDGSFATSGVQAVLIGAQLTDGFSCTGVSSASILGNTEGKKVLCERHWALTVAAVLCCR